MHFERVEVLRSVVDANENLIVKGLVVRLAAAIIAKKREVCNIISNRLNIFELELSKECKIVLKRRLNAVKANVSSQKDGSTFAVLAPRRFTRK